MVVCIFPQTNKQTNTNRPKEKKVVGLEMMVYCEKGAHNADS